MRLILHAGTHKTGTSTLQAMLDEHRETLSEHGLVYPDSTPWFEGTHRAHHPLAHAFASGADSVDAARRMLRHVRTRSEEGDVILLSAEPVYRHVLPHGPGGWWGRHEAYLRRLADGLVACDFCVEVVVVFRRRDAFIESLYHERAAQGFGRDFATLLHRSDRLLDYDRQLKLFRAAFPRVRTYQYEMLAAEDLVPAFLDRLGIRDLPNLVAPTWERRSVDARLSLWMVAAYRDNPDDELVMQRRRFAKNPVSDELFDDYGCVTLWPNRQSRREMLDRYGDHAPIEDYRAPAVLTPELEARIDDAFDVYLEAKGLPPTRRSTRTAG